MIDDVAVLVLPLMHHLVEQCVQRFRPSVAADVATADHDLDSIVVGARRAVVSEAALHSARDANGHVAELSREVLPIVVGVPGLELPHHRGVGRVGGLAGPAHRRRPLDRIGEDRTPRRRAVGPRATAGEGDDRGQHRGRRAQKRFVDAELASAEADDDRSIPGQPAGVEALEAEGAEAREQLDRRSGRRGELEDELSGVGTVAPEEVAQRAKHCEAPGTKVRILSDQIEVETSIEDEPRVITFTDDGRPPRDRFDTVPAVEITVPFFVCST